MNIIAEKPQHARPILPRFITTNNNRYMFKSLELPNNDCYSQSECLVFRPNRVNEGAKSIGQIEPKLLEQMGRASSIVFELDLQPKLLEKHSKRAKKTPNWDGQLRTSKALSSRQPIIQKSLSPIFTDSQNDKELVNHRKLIDTTMHSIALERERFKQTIQKERENFRRLKQLDSDESYYTNSKILHQRKVVRKQRRIRDQRFENIVKLQDEIVNPYLMPARHGPYDVRPWTNSQQDQL